MTPDRFSECLVHLRWTSINLASALQCDLALVEAWESGDEDIPAKLAVWLETLAKAHEALDVPVTHRGRHDGPKQ